MSEPTAHPPVALEALRERTVQALCEHFAADHITADELERRLDGVHAATTPVALRALTSDLPAPGAGWLAAPAYTGVGRSSGAVPDQQVVAAVMGESRRAGVWTPARSVRVLAVMGGVCLDFREAELGPGVTEVTVFALMGGVEITVPPGLRVESSGMGIMGGFEHRGSSAAAADPRAPVLRVSGLGLMGGVEIRVRLPGESSSDARRREKLERRQARRLSRGYDLDD